jgi:hypothetical protein
MDIKEIRRSKLREWLKTHSVPPAEKSLFSQIQSPTGSFGEKVARRLENDYKMGHLYLDTPLGASGTKVNVELIPVGEDLLRRVSEIVTVYSRANARERDAIEKAVAAIRKSIDKRGSDDAKLGT